MYTQYEMVEYIVNKLKDFPEQTLTIDYIEKVLYKEMNIKEGSLTKKDQLEFCKNIKKVLKSLKELGYIRKLRNKEKETWFIKKNIDNITYENGTEVDNVKYISSDELLSIMKKRDAFNGIALAITFIIISLIFYFDILNINLDNISTIVSITLLVFGIFGLGIELDKLSERKEGIGLKNLGVGLGLGLFIVFLWFWVRIYISVWWVTLLFILLLFMPIYGTLLGIPDFDT